MKRNLTAVFALTILASVFTACASDTTTPADDAVDTASVTETQTEAVTEELRPAHNLPEMDFGGKTYRISSVYEGEALALVPDSLNGDSVNDITYERNAYLTETYNFVLEANAKYEGDHQNAVKKQILAGEDAFELILGNNVLTCNNAIEFLYRDLYEIPHLDFTQPWWPAQSVEQMTVYDKMFTITSNAAYLQFSVAEVLIFNKDLLAAHDLALPYDWVRDGSWTMDLMIAQTKDLYRDLNGDGKRDLDDQYGFITHPDQTGFLTSCDAQTLAATEDGGREISVMSDKMVSLVEMLYNWYYESGDALMTTFRGAEEHYTPKVFLKGHTAYSYAPIYYATDNYRHGDINYGIVPMPKFDREQDTYYVWASPSLFSIPITCQNEEFAGFVLEALSYYGYYDVVPAYYEQTLQGKIADAPDDAEMLTIIRDNLTASFAHCYDNWQGFGHLLGMRLGFTEKGGKKDLASAYEKGIKSAQKRLDLVLAGFADEPS